MYDFFNKLIKEIKADHHKQYEHEKCKRNLFQNSKLDPPEELYRPEECLSFDLYDVKLRGDFWSESPNDDYEEMEYLNDDGIHNNMNIPIPRPVPHPTHQSSHHPTHQPTTQTALVNSSNGENSNNFKSGFLVNDSFSTFICENFNEYGNPKIIEKWCPLFVDNTIQFIGIIENHNQKKDRIYKKQTFKTTGVILGFNKDSLIIYTSYMRYKLEGPMSFDFLHQYKKIKHETNVDSFELSQTNWIQKSLEETDRLCGGMLLYYGHDSSLISLFEGAVDKNLLKVDDSNTVSKSLINSLETLLKQIKTTADYAKLLMDFMYQHGTSTSVFENQLKNCSVIRDKPLLNSTTNQDEDTRLILWSVSLNEKHEYCINGLLVYRDRAKKPEDINGESITGVGASGTQITTEKNQFTLVGPMYEWAVRRAYPTSENIMLARYFTPHFENGLSNDWMILCQTLHFLLTCGKLVPNEKRVGIDSVDLDFDNEQSIDETANTEPIVQVSTPNTNSFQNIVESCNEKFSPKVRKHNKQLIESKNPIVPKGNYTKLPCIKEIDNLPTLTVISPIKSNESVTNHITCNLNTLNGDRLLANPEISRNRPVTHMESHPNSPSFTTYNESSCRSMLNTPLPLTAGTRQNHVEDSVDLINCKPIYSNNNGDIKKVYYCSVGLFEASINENDVTVEEKKNEERENNKNKIKKRGIKRENSKTKKQRIAKETSKKKIMEREIEKEDSKDKKQRIAKETCKIKIMGREIEKEDSKEKKQRIAKEISKNQIMEREIEQEDSKDKKQRIENENNKNGKKIKENYKSENEKETKIGNGCKENEKEKEIENEQNVVEKPNSNMIKFRTVQQEILENFIDSVITSTTSTPFKMKRNVRTNSSTENTINTSHQASASSFKPLNSILRNESKSQISPRKSPDKNVRFTFEYSLNNSVNDENVPFKRFNTFHEERQNKRKATKRHLTNSLESERNEIPEKLSRTVQKPSDIGGVFVYKSNVVVDNIENFLKEHESVPDNYDIYFHKTRGSKYDLLNLPQSRGGRISLPPEDRLSGTKFSVDDDSVVIKIKERIVYKISTPDCSRRRSICH